MRKRTRLWQLILSLATFTLLTPSFGRADPLTFANVRAFQLDPLDVTHSFSTDLFAMPGAVLTRGTIVTLFIDVAGILPPGATDALRLTYQQPGGVGTVVQEYGIPVFGDVLPPFTLVTGLNFPVFYHPVPVELTVDLLGSSPDYVIPGGPMAGQLVDSYTFSFSVVQPVPEPATVVLVATGVTALGIRGARRRRNG